GVVSCSFPCIQRYKLITTPATWVSPTSHIAPDDEWSNPEETYDGDIDTRGLVGINPGRWSSYLILIVNEQYIDKVRFYARYVSPGIDKIDVAVYYEGDWHDVYEGIFADREWVEKSIPDGIELVSKARVRFYNSRTIRYAASLHEFMLNTSGETAQEGIYFDTHAIIPYLPQAPYIVPAGATFLVRVYNDEEAIHNMSVSLAGYLQSKV
ncbi:unnamed protein product, partial [marine sediment metagenome]